MTSPDLDRYLCLLFGPVAPEALIEVRFRRRAGGMGQLFYARDALIGAAQTIQRLGQQTDVYIGVAARIAPSGRRSSIDEVRAIWADCDSQEAAAALARFEPAPSIVVRSGSAHGCHAYWLLDAPITPDLAEHANRRIALALRADGRAADAARILRPPSTRNFKYDPPADVDLKHADDQRQALEAVLRNAPALAVEHHVACRPARERRARNGDPLLAIRPGRYVTALLGVEIGRSRKIRCPFHPDSTPSLHVYDTAEGGWYCYGCGRGTSIYDFAAALWGLSTRGPDFRALRERLTAVFPEAR
jgi:hypothetical protein